jgi:hypothetical protein
MRRLSLIFLPFLAAFALVFGSYYVYASFRLFQAGRAVPAALTGIYGIMGVGLASAIWVARRRMVAARKRPPA